MRRDGIISCCVVQEMALLTFSLMCICLLGKNPIFPQYEHLDIFELPQMFFRLGARTFLYHIIILLYFVVGSTFVIAPNLGAKTILSWSHFEDDSSPYISWSGSSIRISHTFVLFKHVTLIWINYLETWLCSDNTSCYYT